MDVFVQMENWQFWVSNDVIFLYGFHLIFLEWNNNLQSQIKNYLFSINQLKQIV